MLDSGEDPLAVAKKFRDRLYGVHIKDFVFDRAGNAEDVISGTGVLALDGFARYLVDSKFDGYLTLEYEGEPENPVPNLQACVKNINAAFAR